MHVNDQVLATRRAKKERGPLRYNARDLSNTVLDTMFIFFFTTFKEKLKDMMYKETRREAKERKTWYIINMCLVPEGRGFFITSCRGLNSTNKQATKQQSNKTRKQESSEAQAASQQTVNW